MDLGDCAVGRGAMTMAARSQRQRQQELEDKGTFAMEFDGNANSRRWRQAWTPPCLPSVRKPPPSTERRGDKDWPVYSDGTETKSRLSLAKCRCARCILRGNSIGLKVFTSRISSVMQVMICTCELGRSTWAWAARCTCTAVGMIYL